MNIEARRPTSLRAELESTDNKEELDSIFRDKIGYNYLRKHTRGDDSLFVSLEGAFLIRTQLGLKMKGSRAERFAELLENEGVAVILKQRDDTPRTTNHNMGTARAVLRRHILSEGFGKAAEGFIAENYDEQGRLKSLHGNPTLEEWKIERNEYVPTERVTVAQPYFGYYSPEGEMIPMYIEKIKDEEDNDDVTVE